MNEYFIPNIEDIRVGYEFEQFAEGRPGYPEWLPNCRVETGDDLEYIRTGEWIIRVPYLTKEQIEKEGWKITGRELKPAPYKVDWINARKGDFKLWINLALTDIMHMGIDEEYGIIYRGQCKDINTFRYICKLLNI